MRTAAAAGRSAGAPPHTLHRRPALRPHLLLLLLLLWQVCGCCGLRAGIAAAAPPLRFRDDGTFRIVQFADLHYGEGEDVRWGPQQDRNSTRVMRQVGATHSQGGQRGWLTRAEGRRARKGQSVCVCVCVCVHVRVHAHVRVLGAAAINQRRRPGPGATRWADAAPNPTT